MDTVFITPYNAEVGLEKCNLDLGGHMSSKSSKRVRYFVCNLDIMAQGWN